MNLYIDTSALITHYIAEVGSEYVNDLIVDAAVIATGLITRAEMAAGINRLLRMNSISKDHYAIALRDFRSDWKHYERIMISEEIVARADSLTCEYILRGYDATHLAVDYPGRTLSNCLLYLSPLMQNFVTLLKKQA